MKIAPSLAVASQTNLQQVVADLEAAQVDMLHFDVEDGSFAPVMTLGTRLIGDLRPLTALPFDVHLMMVNPEWLLPELAASGAQRISVHWEACPYPRRTLRQIADLGCVPGLALNPASALPDLSYLSPYLQIVNLLTTEPEIPGGAFLPDILEKLRIGKQRSGAGKLEWIVDGGVNAENISQVVAAGADTVVVGRAAFAPGKIEDNLRQLRKNIAGTKTSE